MIRLLTAAALCALAAPAFAQGPLPLSKILTTVEAGGTRIVVSADRERRGGWEVVSCPVGSRLCREDHIDPVSGAVLKSELEGVGSLPDIGAKPASAVASQIEAMAIGAITEIEFDDRVWEAKVRDGRRRAEFRLHPMTGAVTRCKGSLCPR
ncbi:MAG: PepSY domain-containing protein [Xanthobacteraceae bacterium]|nr:PepSY domain-containing protein [Xanthobacteraceae bacterium]